jgi:RNA polymerase sigma factor (TIGR02999 family)
MADDPDKPATDAPQSLEIAGLWEQAHAELRSLARSRLRASGPLTLLDTTGLISETFARLARQHNLRVESRAHFLAYCARVMRSVIVDLVREKQAERRGAGAIKITLNTAIGDAVAVDDEPLRVDEALSALGQLEPRLAKVVEMRYFGGYNEDEIAELLGIKLRTVQRDWQKARMLLQTMLAEPG